MAQNNASTDSLQPVVKTVIEDDVLTEEKVVQDSINSTLVPLHSENITLKTLPEDFQQKYLDAEFQYDVKKESGLLSLIRKWWRAIVDWFSIETSNSNLVIDEIVNIVLVILGIIAFGFLLYYLNKKGFIKLFSKKSEVVINEKYIEENIEKIDFEALTQTAKEENNLRKAIRYYYLWMLKNWSQNNLINYEPNKTTKKYVSELTNTNNKTSFQYISYIYDNVWYGYHDISASDFFKIEQQFLELIQKKS